jgi:hypothetical protein
MVELLHIAELQVPCYAQALEGEPARTKHILPSMHLKVFHSSCCYMLF